MRLAARCPCINLATGASAPAPTRLAASAACALQRVVLVGVAASRRHGRPVHARTHGVYNSWRGAAPSPWHARVLLIAARTQPLYTTIDRGGTCSIASRRRCSIRLHGHALTGAPPVLQHVPALLLAPPRPPGASALQCGACGNSPQPQPWAALGRIRMPLRSGHAVAGAIASACRCIPSYRPGLRSPAAQLLCRQEDPSLSTAARACAPHSHISALMAIAGPPLAWRHLICSKTCHDWIDGGSSTPQCPCTVRQPYLMYCATANCTARDCTV